ncbi:kelch-like protein 2 [Adelges cooleyi]|uniref:kelch-like protein 2 n=1 Tax=Adelges cooleyi TaxID=133065 RepID=UPI002180114B|nr:kelch-like protein 2 [Adelges cooleyi]
MEVIVQEHFEKMYEFYENKEFCDIVLVTDEGLKIEAHRNILASASHVFYRMFSDYFKERNEKEIHIKEIDSEVLELFVKYAYTCKLDVKEKNCEKLLMAADMYRLKYIEELCFDYIKENINPTNCLSFMKTSKVISDKKIYNFCWSYVLTHFTTIVNSDQALETLYDYELDDVVEFIARDDLAIDSEEKIFDFIIGWIRYNEDERNDLLPILMKYLRLPLISKKGLQRIYNEPLVVNNNDVKTSMLHNMITTYNSSKPSHTLGRCTQTDSSNTHKRYIYNLYCNTSKTIMEVIMQEHFEKMYEFYENKEFCDIILVTDEGLKIEAHRNILASASHVFYRMFSDYLRERNEKEIHIKEIDSEILELFVKYAYTCKLDIKEKNCEKLLMAADMYRLKYTEELCFDYIKENINPTNCLSFMKTSKVIPDKKIYNFCWSYVLTHFTTIVNSDQALETLYGYELYDVVEFIARDDLAIDSEEKIFDFIIGWIRYNEDERNDLLPILMKYLRLPLISKEGLQRIYNEPLVVNNNDVKTSMLHNMITYNSSKPSYTLGRCSQIDSSNIIFGIAGDPDLFCYYVYYMDIRNYYQLKWKPSKQKFFFPRRFFSTVVVSDNGIILAIGGDIKGRGYVNLVDELDLKSKSKQWVSTRTLKQPRTSFAVCTYKQYIYVVGGQDISSNRLLNSVEYYNTNSKVWTEITEPMPTARIQCSATIFKNKLYVFGGCENIIYLDTVECYDFEMKHWEKLDPMPICNFDMGVSRRDNVVYLIGGGAAPQRIFKFDLQNFKWDEMPKMNMNYSGYCSIVVFMKNDLFVFGNINGELHCEKYDRGKMQWQLVDRIGGSWLILGYIFPFNNITLKSYGIQL